MAGEPGPVRIDLSAPRRIHVVGVGGAGMSAIASVLAGMGHQVSGSDLVASPVLERLDDQGVRTAVGHDGRHLGDAELVAVSTAVAADNPEVRAARERDLPVLRRAEILAAIAAVRRTVAVAGTHGKTTTSSMLAVVMRAAGWDPSFIIGGEVADLGGGAHWGAGEWFVVEADESDGTFLEIPRAAAIVTNVEPDHLDHYGGVEGLEAAFGRFVAETDGPVVACADDEGSARLAGAATREVVTYGTDGGSMLAMSPPTSDAGGVRWEVRPRGGQPVPFRLDTPGDHQARNATAAAALAWALGIPLGTSAAALAAYRGVARRFQRRGEAGGVTFVDDYAHLPTEVRAALAAARAGGHRRVVAVFQPHRYSRTASLWPTFADAFEGADLLVLTDVYPAGEAPRPGVDGHLILDAVLDAHPDQPVAYLPRRSDLRRWVPDLLRPGDLCLSLGAGDLTACPDEWITSLGGSPPGRPS